jgi:hypothetical protein
VPYGTRFQSRIYIDANRFVNQIITNITIDVAYHAKPGHYNAPSTSVVASSLMGKSRLLKELARQRPSVYIFLRPESSSGYPNCSDVIADILLEASPKSLPDQEIDEQNANSFCAAKYSLFLLHMLGGLTDLIQSPPETLTSRDHSLFWEFFAETPKHPGADLRQFWNKVVAAVKTELDGLNTHYALSTFSSGIGHQLSKAFQTFSKKYVSLGYSNDPDVPLLFFDEARHLCQTSAFNAHTIITRQEFIDLSVSE